MIPHEEHRTTKWFLIISYFIVIGYDVFYYYIIPTYISHEEIFLSENWFLTYIVLTILLPIFYYLNRVNKQYLIKYVFVINYLIITFLVDILTYYGDVSHTYKSGNVLEVFFILSIPLFINTKYFGVVTLGVAARYLFTGLILKTNYVVMPLFLLIILASVSYLLLIRFQGYVKAIRNLYDTQLEGIVKGVIATLELKDPYTRGHSERVASYALLLANELEEFPKEKQKSFYYACLLHDIGKVHIPDQILMKPGKLSKEEFEIIQTHPAVGAEAVKNVEGIKDCICVIRSHHERWDGNGYPDKLKGEEIPLLARVTSVADAFDAMTSSRSYRAAMSVEEAFDHIIEGTATQFDPLIVEKFKNIFPEMVNFHKSYPWDKKWELTEEVRK